MHEISLVKNIFNTLEIEFPGELLKIRNIHLTVGILSNIQPLLMQSAFEAVLLDQPQYQHTSLTVEVLPVLIKCETCGRITEVKDYRFICICGKPGKNIIQGEELLISKVEFADEIESPVLADHFNNS
ncbi:MAG: hydrogenase maturation nickel metallochaperone HypA [Saprospiraceae bacterium]